MKFKMMILAGLFIVVTTLGGCLAIHAEDGCHCSRKCDKFADKVAKKVVELQKQQPVNSEM